MSDGASSPVWAKARARAKRSGDGGLVGLIVTLLALFGVLTAVLGIRERSFEKGGALMDGWIAAGTATARELVGQAPEAAETAVKKAGAAAEKTGEVLEAEAGSVVEPPTNQ